ncbi:unnamed protein product [Dicrocoelium dendriticum]|nr:unnamed protein product [Dicrocoelium dendriticum]
MVGGRGWSGGGHGQGRGLIWGGVGGVERGGTGVIRGVGGGGGWGGCEGPNPARASRGGEWWLRRRPEQEVQGEQVGGCGGMWPRREVRGGGG